MKAQSITTLFLAALLVAACGPQGDELEAKKAELQAAKSQLADLKANISTLEAEIREADPDYFKSANLAVQVTAYEANRSTFEHKIEVRGSVMSRTNVQVGAEIGGRLTRVAVKEGQRVNKGQTLATIDQEDIKRNIESVQTQLDFAITMFEKRERLWKKNIGTEVQYLEAKTNKETLEKQLATLQTQLEKTTIKAPFSGTIETVPVKAGQVVQPGIPVAFLVSNSDMYITAEISEVFIGKFEVGDEVLVKVPSIDDSFTSKIVSIGQVINEASRTFTVEVAVSDKNTFKTNQVVILQMVDHRSEDAVIIPSRTIQEDADGNFVFLIDGNKAKKVHINLGLSYDNHTMVMTGLNGGESIVDKGNRSVADGSVVTLQN